MERDSAGAVTWSDLAGNRVSSGPLSRLVSSDTGRQHFPSLVLSWLLLVRHLADFG